MFFETTSFFIVDVLYRRRLVYIVQFLLRIRIKYFVFVQFVYMLLSIPFIQNH